MESLAHVVKVSIPKYFSNLPVPDSFGGIFRLSLGEWISLTPLLGFLAGTTYISYRAFFATPKSDNKSSSTPSSSTGAGASKTKVNLTIKKDNPKVVDSVDIEEIGEKKVFCRCWRSQKFPYCDGSHTNHNNETGDNVGPLIIKK